MHPDQFHQLADLLPDSLLLVSADGTLLAANPPAVAQFAADDRNPAAQLGCRLADLVVDAPESVAEKLTAWVRSREKTPTTLTLRGPDGRPVRRRCEGGLVAADVLLLRLVPPGAAERAEELAEAARRKETFLRMMAHELRNPLAPLAIGLETLRRTVPDVPVAAETVDRMGRQVRHLSRVVDQLVDVTRLADGTLTLRRERTDLAAAVRRVVDDQRSALEEAGLVVRADLPVGPVWVHGDAARLAQAAANLLEVAGRFTPSGGRIDVRLAQAGDRAELILRDTGAGIPADVLGWLSEPFAQADHGLDRARGGSWLGLALVKGVAELHGGGVRAAAGGPGTEFVLWLPAETRPAAGRGGRRVLIVEDNRDAADSLHALLTILGHDVRVAYTGPDGVAAAHDFRPTVIVCDIGLPDLDGYGVARAVRRDPDVAGALMIAVTGYGQDEDKRRAIEAGFDHHLTKPAPPEVLLQLLNG